MLSQRNLFWCRAASPNAADIFVEFLNKQEINALFDGTALTQMPYVLLCYMRANNRNALIVA